MTPEEAADLIRQELCEALAEQGSEGGLWRVESVEPPEDLGPNTCFLVALASPATPKRTVRIPLPTTLALGYLADEEAAVDEWKGWLKALRER